MPQIRQRTGNTIPFGWKLLEEGPTVFSGKIEEIPEEIEALEKAKWYVGAGYTLQSTRDWLVKTTKREITLPGMLKAIKNVRHRNPNTNQIED